MQPGISRNDPLQYTLPLPLEAEFFPMGFPLRLATNSKDVLRTATQMWSRFSKRFERPATRVNVAVGGETVRGLPQHPPVLRGQEHLISIVADSANFAGADLNTGFGHICVSREAASDAAYLRYHFLEPLAYVLIAARHAALVHASCVALDGRGVVLSGASGMGKTSLAYACARHGWTFISGDAVAVTGVEAGLSLAGRPFEIRFRHSATRLFPELGQFPRMLRPSGKTDIEIDPTDLGLAAAVECTASLLIFLDRAERPVTPSLHHLSPEAARRKLEEGICFGDQSVRERHGRMLDRLAQVPALRLRYSDCEAAERALRALLSE